MLLKMARLHSFYGWIIFHYIYIYINIFFIHSYVDKHLNYFYKLAIVNNCPMACGYIPFLISAFISFGYIPRSEISGSCSSTFLVFWRISHCFLRWLHQCAYPIVRKDSIFSLPCQHLLFLVLFIIVILTNVNYLIVVMIVTSLMVNDVEHLFM